MALALLALLDTLPRATAAHWPFSVLPFYLFALCSFRSFAFRASDRAFGAARSLGRRSMLQSTRTERNHPRLLRKSADMYMNRAEGTGYAAHVAHHLKQDVFLR